MKTLLLALTLVILPVIATYAALSALHVEQDLAGSAAGIFLGAIPYVHKTLERRSKQPIPALARNEIVSLEGFTIPNLVLLAYATLITLSVMNAIGFVAGAVTALLGDGLVEANLRAVLPAVLLFTLPVAYLIGRWLGIRAGGLGAVVVIATFVIVATAEQLVRWFVMSDEEFLQVFGQPREPGTITLQWLGGIVFFSVIALVGFWRGRRMRLMRYADYLLRKLPSSTRDTLLTLMRDEVLALSKHGGQ